MERIYSRSVLGVPRNLPPQHFAFSYLGNLYAGYAIRGYLSFNGTYVFVHAVFEPCNNIVQTAPQKGSGRGNWNNADFMRACDRQRSVAGYVGVSDNAHGVRLAFRYIHAGAAFQPARLVHLFFRVDLRRACHKSGALEKSKSTVTGW